MKKPIKLWLVTVSHCEGSTLMDASIHSTYRRALTAWNRLRLSLLNDAREGCKDGHERLYAKQVSALRERDPKKISNYPHETPIIKEFNLDAASEVVRVARGMRVVVPLVEAVA